MSTLTAEVQHRGDTAVIHLAGYLSAEASGAVEEAFKNLGDAEKVLLVFQEGDFITSAGLAVVFDCVLPLQAKGKKARIVQPSKHFRKIFDIVGLSKDVEIFTAEDQALADW